MIGALFSLDFFDFVKQCANSVLAAAKHLPIPCEKSPSRGFLILTESSEISAKRVLVPCVVDYIITPRVSNPCRFKTEWLMCKGLSWVWDKQNGSMIRLNCSKMKDTSFRVGKSARNATDSSVQPLLYDRISPFSFGPCVLITRKTQIYGACIEHELLEKVVKEGSPFLASHWFIIIKGVVKVTQTKPWALEFQTFE